MNIPAFRWCSRMCDAHTRSYLRVAHIGVEVAMGDLKPVVDRLFGIHGRAVIDASDLASVLAERLGRGRRLIRLLAGAQKA